MGNSKSDSGNIATDALDEIASFGSGMVEGIADLLNPFSTSSNDDDDDDDDDD